MTTSDYSSTSHPEVGATIEEVLSLGSALANTLDKDDFLGRWMAHYFAERLDALSRLSGLDRARAEDELADRIVGVWSARNAVPFENAPLATSDAVAEALVRLAPNRPDWHYYSAFRPSNAPTQVDVETFASLKLALEVDRVCGDLVHALVTHAATLATEVDAPWLEVARSVGENPALVVQDLAEWISASADSGAKGSKRTNRSELRTRVDRASRLMDAIQAAMSDESDAGSQEASD